MPDNELRLYGRPGAERLHFDLASAVEAYADECDLDRLPTKPVVFEEFDTCPVRNHMPSVDRVLEYIHEYVCEYGCVDEGFCDAMEGTTRGQDVHDALDAVLDLIALKNPYRMADNHLRDINVRYLPDPVYNENPTWDWEIVE